MKTIILNNSLKITAVALFMPLGVMFSITHKTTLRNGDDKKAYTLTTKEEESHELHITNGHREEKWDTNIEPSEGNDKTLWQRQEGANNSLHVYKIMATQETPLHVSIKATWKPESGGNSPIKLKSARLSLPKEVELKWQTDMNSKTGITDPSKRTKLGIGETVHVYVSNSHLGNPTWSIKGPSGGSASIYPLSPGRKGNWPMARFVAGEKAGLCTITATFPTGHSKVLNFTVVEPYLSEAVKIPNDSETQEEIDRLHKNGTHSLVVMLNAFRVGSTDFSYENVECGESDENMLPGSTNPTNITGEKAFSEPHKPNFPTRISDESNPRNDMAALFFEVNYIKEHWKDFSYQWDIKYMFRVTLSENLGFPQFERPPNSTSGDGWHEFENQTDKRNFTQTMTMKVSKTPDDGFVYLHVRKFTSHTKHQWYEYKKNTIIISDI